MLKHLLVTVAAKFVQLRLPEMKSEGVPFSEGRISPWLIKSSSNTFPSLSPKWWAVKKETPTPRSALCFYLSDLIQKMKELQQANICIYYKILVPHLNNNISNNDT